MVQAQCSVTKRPSLDGTIQTPRRRPKESRWRFGIRALGFGIDLPRQPAAAGARVCLTLWTVTVVPRYSSPTRNPSALLDCLPSCPKYLLNCPVSTWTLLFSLLLFSLCSHSHRRIIASSHHRIIPKSETTPSTTTPPPHPTISPTGPSGFSRRHGELSAVCAARKGCRRALSRRQ